MFWFALFASSVFGLYFWREYRIQQQDLQSASAPHRVGERYIGQVLTLNDGIRGGAGRIKLGDRRWSLRGPQRPGRESRPGDRRGRQRTDRRSPARLTARNPAPARRRRVWQGVRGAANGSAP